MRASALAAAVLAVGLAAGARADDGGVRDAGLPDAHTDAGTVAAEDAGTDLGEDSAAEAPEAEPDLGAAPPPATQRARDAGPPDDAAVLVLAALDAAADTVAADAGPADAGVAPEAAADAGPAAATPETAPPPHAPSSGAATRTLLRTIGGLVAVAVLAWLGGLPWVRRIERLLGISQVVTAGFPFVALGVLAHDTRVGILTDDVVRELAPVLQLGLGWLGFLTGFQLDVRALEQFPKGTGRLVVVMTSAPFALVVLGCGALLLSFGQPLRDAIFLRDAIVLGAAATITAPIGARLALERGVAKETQAAVMRIGVLDDIAGVLGMLVLGAYFRPTDEVVAWALPATAWLFVTIGMGVVVGVLGYVILRRPGNATEMVALLLGVVAFCAGMAGYLRLSPLVVCFLAGAILGNLPGDYHALLRSVLRMLERPIYLLLLVITGALWNLRDSQGWLLLPAFVIARIGGRYIGVRLAQRSSEGAALDASEHGVVVAPMGALSIAIVVSFQLLFSGRAVPWIVTAVIGSAIVTEVLVQVTALSGRTREEPTRPEVK